VRADAGKWPAPTTFGAVDAHAEVPFGRWPSPLSATQAAVGRVSLSGLRSDATGLYWLEGRPSDGGRSSLVHFDGERAHDLSPPGVSMRSRVYEYGGGAFCLLPGHGAGACAYVDQADQRIWVLRDGAARPLTPEPPPGARWSHGGLTASADGLWVLAVREISGTGTGTGAEGPGRAVVALSTASEGAVATVLAAGHDFYGAPSLRPSGDSMVVTAWDHPDMPWDASVILLVTLRVEESGHVRRLQPVGDPMVVAGGADVSVGQPHWSADGRIRYVSDAGSWWQPYLVDAEATGPAWRLSDAPAEFHGPDWVLGQCTTTELGDGTLVARRSRDGRDALVAWAPGSGEARVVEQPCVAISAVCAYGSGLAFIGATPTSSDGVWVMDSLETPAQPVRPTTAILREGEISLGQPLQVTAPSGRPVHALFYPPALGGTRGPDGEAPPLLVTCHSGPTGSAGAGYDVVLQYFTSRGFAVAAVDYIGSTGYGREYRCGLWGQWGDADAEDCLRVAQHLAEAGWVDGGRMAIRGQSAGGMTALNALTLDPGDRAGFAAAATRYAVTDLLALAQSTHEFEAHYNDRLIGPLPECSATYEARSPLRRAAELRGSILLFQGTDDPVVPVSQAEDLERSATEAGQRVVVRLFEGEGHGFRRAETLVACLEDELAFYLEELRL
jgi:dienelactone hydrolase